MLGRSRKLVYDGEGHCPCCDSDVRFTAEFDWFRDHLLCSQCGCIPRERAIMRVIEQWVPGWRELAIHESSPCGRGASLKLARGCSRYLGTHFREDVPSGQVIPGTPWRCESLEAQTFPDESFDLVISQDVMEHLLDPAEAMREIARTLEPGGAHIFTVPLVNRERPSEVRARRGEDGSIEIFGEPEYHGNPIDDEGSLVTMNWGFDITDHIFDACGLSTAIVQIDDLSQGIRAELIEVCVTRKRERPAGG